MIRALDACADRAVWLEIWHRTGREPFAHPDFVALFAKDHGTAMALVDEQGSGSALLPIVRRNLPMALGSGFDAVSPYGYGGPFASGKPDWAVFYEGVLAWMRGADVVTVFVRASLDSETESASHVSGFRALPLSNNVRVDLSRTDDEQWRHVAHKVRKNVNKARRAGLSVRVTEGFTDLDAFLAVYESTMRRRGADLRYLFDQAFFRSLGDISDCVLVADVLEPSGRVVSTELVLVSDISYYSFLGGTLEEAFVHAPNDLLKLAVINHGHASGKGSYVLGGGYQPDDGIYRYKLAFDAEGVVPFHGIQLVGNEERYNSLVEQADELRGSSTSVAGPYFPAYRCP